jgi:hypothetical protein
MNIINKMMISKTLKVGTLISRTEFRRSSNVGVWHALQTNQQNEWLAFEEGVSGIGLFMMKLWLKEW